MGRPAKFARHRLPRAIPNDGDGLEQPMGLSPGGHLRQQGRRVEVAQERLRGPEGRRATDPGRSEYLLPGPVGELQDPALYGSDGRLSHDIERQGAEVQATGTGRGSDHCPLGLTLSL